MPAAPLIASLCESRTTEAGVVSSVRSQAACVRALLDEVERAVPSAVASAVHAQLVEELARLGCRFLEAASALATAVDEQSRGSSPDASRRA